MKITILVENTVSTKAPPGLLGQHGLAMLLEMPGGEKILFDTGQTDILAENMRTMGIVPDSIDYVVLSHGHFDHCGGLRSFFKARCSPAKVFSGPDIFAARYTRAAGGYRHIGIPHTKEQLADCGAEFVVTCRPYRMRENIWLSGPISQSTDFEEDNPALLNFAQQTDLFTDETAIYVIRTEGLVVIAGCAHRGIINTIKHGQKITGIQKVYAVIGGSHLEAAGPRQKEATIGALRAMDPAIIALNHCTGVKLQGALQRVFGDRFISANAGNVIHI